MSEEFDDLHSIGNVALATGISVDTVRVWERRYGKPVPVRLPSGHRRYTDAHVRWLRRIAEALSRGHRPSKVVGLPEKELDLLLEPGRAGLEENRAISELLRLVVEYRGDELRRIFAADAENLGPRAFLDRRVAPLLTAAGRAWADGTIQVRHEHFLSSILQDVLREVRRGLDESPGGPVIVLATLAEETHGLGLQMAATIAVIAGARPRLVGTDLPNEEIVNAAVEIGADAVGISISLATGGVQTDRIVADLRRTLPRKIELIVGGSGARGVRRGPRGVT